MLEAIMHWLATLTMEEVFIISGIGVLLLGVGLALLIGWIFEKDDGGDEDGK